MSEPEPRRSVRATKGQHKALEQMDAEMEPPKRRGKKGKKIAAPEPEEPEEEIIRCVCGATEQDEDSGEPWIACDKCGAWQHNICMGLSKYNEDLPKEYFCELCRPDNHKELLAGIARGERPWEARRKVYEEEESAGKKKKPGKRGRKRQSDQKEEVEKAEKNEKPEKVEKEPNQSSVPPHASSPPAPAMPSVPQPNPTPPAPALSASPATPSDPALTQPPPAIKKDTKGPAGTKRKVRDEANDKEVKPANKMRKVSETEAAPSTAAPSPAAPPMMAPLTTAQSPVAPPPSAPVSTPTVTPASAPPTVPAHVTPVPAPTASASPPALPIPASASVPVPTPVPTPNQPPVYEAPADLPAKITDLPEAHRQTTANALLKSLMFAIEATEKSGAVVHTDGVSLVDRAERYALQIERAVRDCQRTMTQYNQQCRTLNFNLKKNLELYAKLVSGELTPMVLGGMASSDLATMQKQKETAEMKARLDKQSIRTTSDMPRIRKTHKGDEVIAEDSFVVPAEEEPMPSFPRSREQAEPSNAVPTAEPAQLPVQSDPLKAASPPRDLRIETKQSPTQTNFDLNQVLTSVKSPEGPPARKPSLSVVPAAAPVNVSVDRDVDRLLRESSEEYSPTDDFMHVDPQVVWKGKLIMPSIAEFDVTANYVAGNNLPATDESITWQSLLPNQLSVCGRIEVQKAEEYLCTLRYNENSDIIVVKLEPTLAANKADLVRLYEYFVSKKRYGVLADKHNANIRDTYLLPVLPGGPELQPEFMQNLYDNIAPQERSEPMLYVALVHRSDDETIRKKRAQVGLDSSASARTSSMPNKGTVGIPGPAPAFSPTSPQGQFPSSGAAQATPTPALRNGHAPLLTEAQRRADAAAIEVLGPHANCPTAVFLRPQFQAMERHQLEMLRTIYDRDPRTRTDHMHLNTMIMVEADRSVQAQSNSPTVPGPSPPSGTSLGTQPPRQYQQPYQHQQPHQYQQPHPGAISANQQSHQQNAQAAIQQHRPQQPSHSPQPPQPQPPQPRTQSYHVPPVKQTPIPPPPIPHHAMGAATVSSNAGGPPRQTPIPPPVIPHAATHAAAASSAGASS